MKFCSFDLEIAKEIPGGETDWDSLRPLGISCAATLCSGAQSPALWFNCLEHALGLPEFNSTRYGPKLTRNECRELVDHLQRRRLGDYIPLTWNGLSFDFRTLAEESGMHQECKELALSHVDMMFQLICLLGYPVGLDTVLKAMGFAGKQGMTGADAPRIWKTDPGAVLRYVAGDVEQPLALAEQVQKTGVICWRSKSGQIRSLNVDHWLTVQECLKLPLPDTSWMDEPRTRESWYAWTCS
jgi:hypothetical protein